MRKAVTIDELMNKTFIDIPFEGQWRDTIGEPQMSGTWIIWGHSGNGKTSFALQLAKELTKYTKTKVAYLSMEEKARKTMQLACKRNNMQTVKSKFQILTDDMEDLKDRLRRRKSPDIIFIDSFQYSGLSKPDYIAIKEEFQDKLFIFISHADGKNPKGRPADFVKYDADVKIRVEGYKAIPVSRLGGGEPFIIWNEGAAKYWGEIQ